VQSPSGKAGTAERPGRMALPGRSVMPVSCSPRGAGGSGGREGDGAGSRIGSLCEKTRSKEPAKRDDHARRKNRHPASTRA